MALQHFVDGSVHEEVAAEDIEIGDALKAPDREKFIKAMKKEVQSLIHETKTLVPITIEQAQKLQHIRIGTSFKCKRKKRGSGKPDKHKVRGAGRGDELARWYKKHGVKPPPTYSPTVGALTFATMLQLAVIIGLFMATTDITSAYLQCQYPDTARPLVTKLPKNVAIMCGLDPEQQYRIKNTFMVSQIQEGFFTSCTRPH